MLETAEGLGAALNRRRRSVPAAADKNAGEPPFCCGRATWRRLAVHGVAAGAKGRGRPAHEGSWRTEEAWAAPSMAEPVTGAGVPPKRQRCRSERSRASRGRTRGQGRGLGRAREAYPGACRFGREHVQNARSARAPGMHGRCSVKCQSMLGSLGAAAN